VAQQKAYMLFYQRIPQREEGAASVASRQGAKAEGGASPTMASRRVSSDIEGLSVEEVAPEEVAVDEVRCVEVGGVAEVGGHARGVSSPSASGAPSKRGAEAGLGAAASVVGSPRHPAGFSVGLIDAEPEARKAPVAPHPSPVPPPAPDSHTTLATPTTQKTLGSVPSVVSPKPAAAPPKPSDPLPSPGTSVVSAARASKQKESQLTASKPLPGRATGAGKVASQLASKRAEAGVAFPEYTIERLPGSAAAFDGRDYYELSIKLPAMESIRQEGCGGKVSADCYEFRAPGYYRDLRVPWPSRVDDKQAISKFRKVKHVLTVQAPIAPPGTS